MAFQDVLNNYIKFIPPLFLKNDMILLGTEFSENKKNFKSSDSKLKLC